MEHYRVPRYRFLHSHGSDKIPYRNLRLTLLFALLTIISLSFTVFFAYNSSLEHPVTSTLIFHQPTRSILVLNILSQVTIFCLSELTSTILDALRWAFVCSASGTSAYTFLALGRATNVIGVLSLILGSGTESFFQRDGHRLWGCQR